MFIYSHNSHSQGAKRLAKELGIKRILHNNSRFNGRRGPLVINWGASAIPLPWAERVQFLNPPREVEGVSNKLLFFLNMDEIEEGLVPPFTPYPEIAQEWFEKGWTIVERHVLAGHGGQGIRIVSKRAIEARYKVLHDAPLYVKYIPKKKEFRVHICDGNIVDISQKVARGNIKPINWRVRSYNNGFIYQRENIYVPDDVKEKSLESMGYTDLDFGAVDVIWNEEQERAYVLEINSAPGIEGQTVSSYADALRKYK